MSLELKQSLTLSQQLIMTPQLQQAIKLLQLSRLELLETIHQEVQTNPVLEEQSSGESDQEAENTGEGEPFEQQQGDLPEVEIDKKAQEDIDWENYISEYNTPWTDVPYEDKERPSFENIPAPKPDLYSHLMWQLNMSPLEGPQKEIAHHIIANLDESGYLDLSEQEIADLTGQPSDMVLETLRFIQNLDPIGVAARNIQECLLIQARFHDLQGSIAEKILLNHLHDLEEKRYEYIAKVLSVPLNEVLSAVNLIRNLEPKPGRLFSNEETIYVSPDIYVFKVGDDYQVNLNEDGLPKLRISSYYKDMLSNKTILQENTKNYLQEKLRSAAWLIKSIHQRQRTILRVTESIVEHQRDFLDEGITKLKPMVLRDIAEDIQMHESTISRVTSNKYVDTPQGVFELKYFFNSAINSVQGDSVASETVKDHIRNIIKSEKPRNPYSDQEIVEMLKNRNINLARRTVAKYRESLGILPSRKRREAL